MEDPTEDTEIQEETQEAPPDPEPLENSAPEPEAEPEPEAPKKKIPKKYEKADCKKCGKTMSLNTLRYKHKCEVVEEPPPPPKKAAPKRRAQAQQEPETPPKGKAPKRRVQVQEEEEPESPTTRLRNLYAQVQLQRREERRNRFRGFFD